MTTITLQVDAGTAQRARQVAHDRQTTLETLIADYLQQLVGSDEASRTLQVQNLLETIGDLSRPMGGKPWKLREELHER